VATAQGIEEIPPLIVKAAIAARENMETNGGDDVDEVVQVVPPLSRREALQAVTTVQRYLETLGQPFACSLSEHLASFGWHTRLQATLALKDTSITEYFVRKS
jgi:hypothetical protein